MSQDYQAPIPLDNKLTASFTRLNASLDALLTCHSGDNEPSETVPFMLWADTDTGLLKVRNADDDGWVSIASLATPLQDRTLACLGVYGLPSITGTASSVPLNCAIVGSAFIPEIIVPRSGVIMGLSGRLLSARTAGTLSTFVSVNGTKKNAGTDPSAVFDGTTTTYAYAYADGTSVMGIQVSAGDRIGCMYDTASFTPTSNTVAMTVWWSPGT